VSAIAQEIYLDEIANALADAIVDHGAPIEVGANEWLTVAARDSVDRRFVAGDPTDTAMTITLRIRGSDLAALRERKLTREEVRKRVEIALTGLGIRSRSSPQSPNHLWPNPKTPDPVSNMVMPRILLTVLFCVVSAGCGSSAQQPITKLVEPAEIKTGWFDAGVENGKNKLVPTVMLTLRNVSREPVANVQLNAVVRRKGETEEWGGAFMKVIGTEGIPPGGSTKPIVLRSNLGYTGTEPRAVMLKNRYFVDAHVQVLAKHGGSQW
jgi:hypothetical protein